MKTRFLFPHKYKKIGWIFLIPSTLFGLFVIFTDYEPEWLRFSMFTFFEGGVPLFNDGTAFFSIIKTNVANELASIFFLISAMLVAFTKAKNEDEFITKIRLESLVWATFFHFGILLIGMLFVFNLEFFTFMIFNMFTLLILFILKFNISLYKSKRI
tara:strand:+ start:2674 stop:3144 length:471 start_codon:yes stop_codon:yes gene_type:complete